MASAAIAMMPFRPRGLLQNRVPSVASSARPYSSARRLSVWEFIVKNWGPLYALASLVGLVVIILLSKTYAKREDLTALVQRVQRVEQVLADLPSEKELHKLQLEISELRGELREVKPELRQARRLADMLLENELASVQKEKA
jgi:hypothetical protein